MSWKDLDEAFSEMCKASRLVSQDLLVPGGLKVNLDLDNKTLFMTVSLLYQLKSSSILGVKNA